MSVGYTPGPFEYRPDRTIAAAGVPLARCYAGRNAEANGPLLAAAPDNFACNKASTAILEIILAEDWLPESAKQSIRDQVVLNKRSIARATGEQP